MSADFWWTVLFGGLALISQYLPAKYGLPIGFVAIALATWQLGLGSLLNWQSWVVIALIGLLLYRFYREMRKGDRNNRKVVEMVSGSKSQLLTVSPTATVSDLDELYETVNKIVKHKDRLAEELSKFGWESYRPYVLGKESYRNLANERGDKEAILMSLVLSLSNPLLDDKMGSDEKLVGMIDRVDGLVGKIGNQRLHTEIEQLFKLQDEGQRHWVGDVVSGTVNSDMYAQLFKNQYGNFTSTQLGRVLRLVNELRKVVTENGE
jgi:hypothetical protein